MSQTTFTTQSNSFGQYSNGLISGTFKSLASVVIESAQRTSGTVYIDSPLIFIGLNDNNEYYHTGVSSAFTTELNNSREELIIRNGQIDLEINIEDVPPVSVPGATCIGFCIDGQYAYLTLNSGDIYRVNVTSYTPNSGVLMTISGGTLTGATASSRIAVRDGIAYFARQVGNLIEKYTVSGTTFTYVGVFSITSVTDITVDSLEKIAIGKNGWVMFCYRITGGDYRTALLDSSGNIIRNEGASGNQYFCYSIDDVFLSVRNTGSQDSIKVNYIQ